MSSRMGCRVVRLTEKNVAGLDPPGEHEGAREVEYGDCDCVGLKVSVTRGGRRFFGFRYRYRGRKRYLRFGEWPGVTVVEARRMTNEAKGLLARAGFAVP